MVFTLFSPVSYIFEVEEIKEIYKTELTTLSLLIKKFHKFMDCHSFKNALNLVAWKFPRIGNLMFKKCFTNNSENLVFASLHLVKILILFMNPFTPYLSNHAKHFLNIKEEYYNMANAEIINLPCGNQIRSDVETKYKLYEKQFQ